MWETFGAGRAWKNLDQHSEIGFGGFTSPRAPESFTLKSCAVATIPRRSFHPYVVLIFWHVTYIWLFFFSRFFFIPGASCDDKFNPEWVTVEHSSKQTQLNLASADVLPLLLRAVRYVVVATGFFHFCRSDRNSISLSQLHPKAASPVKPRAGSFASPCLLSAPAGTHFALPQRAPDSFVFSSARPTLFTYDIYLQRRRVIKRAEAKNKTPSVLPSAGNYAVHSLPLAR